MLHKREVIGHGGLGKAQPHLEGVTPLPSWGSGDIFKAAGGGISPCGLTFDNQLSDGTRDMDEAGLEDLRLLETWKVP
jgi:hypothetical protein